MRRILSCAVLVCFPCVLPAQTLLVRDLSPKAHLRGDPRANLAIAHGDFDGDGFVDLVFGRAPNPLDNRANLVLFGDGTGGFDRVTNLGPCPGACELTREVITGDVDNDGDLDLLTINQGPTRVWINDGAGSFTWDAQAFDQTPVDGQTGVLGDVDGDGDLDFVWTRDFIREVRLFRNDGSGSFAFAGALPTVLSIGDVTTSLVDLDGDSDLDVLSTGFATNVLINDGQGGFVDETATRWTIPFALNSRGIVADVNGDGFVDAVLGDDLSSLVALNDGNGVFSEAPNALPNGAGVTKRSDLGDIDGDGDLDLFAAGTGKMFRNDGTGQFTEIASAQVALEVTSALDSAGRFVDVDGDGSIDLVLPASTRLLLNDGTGEFWPGVVRPIPFVPERSNSGATSAFDADGDGDIDVIAQGRLMQNDGTGQFEVGLVFAEEPNDMRDVVVGDLDGDGQPDVLARIGFQTRLFVSTGGGNFDDQTDTRLPPGFASDALHLDDFDGDGDLDVVARVGSASVFLINTGAGVFVDETNQRIPSSALFALDAGDADGDGDIDLVTVAELWRNDGSGVFSVDSGAMPQPPASAPPSAYRALLTDLDGDGALDFVAGQTCCEARTLLYLNDGSGTFTNASDRLGDDEFLGPPNFAFDFDENGTPDLAFTQPPQRVLRNLGNATFVDASDRFESFSGATTPADIDGDGDTDLVTPPVLGGILHNATRHLHAPHIARTGREYPIRVFADEIAVGVTLLALGNAPAPTPSPWGTMRVDLSTAYALPKVLIMAGAGHTEFTVQMPASPAAVGLEFHMQTLLATATEWRFTNAVQDCIVH